VTSRRETEPRKPLFSCDSTHSVPGKPKERPSLSYKIAGGLRSGEQVLDLLAREGTAVGSVLRLPVAGGLQRPCGVMVQQVTKAIRRGPSLPD